MIGLKIRKFLFNIYIHLPWNRPLFFLLKEIYLPPYRLRKYLRFTGKFTLTVDNIHLSMMNFGNTIENELFWRGATGWEGRATKIWKTLCEQSTTIFDIGANTGLYSLIGASANPSAAVYAFEPVDLIFNRLKKNIALNNLDVNVHKVALADEDGEGKIFVAKTVSSTFDQASMNNSLVGPQTAALAISKIKLSSFIIKNGIVDIDLMKVDVESFEPNVLEGMGIYLKKFAPTMLIEILNVDVAKKVETLIEGIGYQYYLIDETKGYLRKENLLPSKRGNNFLLLNRAKHKEVHMIPGSVE